jgi:hypothetical protein
LAKVSGLPTSVTVASNVITNDVTNLTVSTPYGVQDVTGLDKLGIERLLLLGDCTGSLSGVFNTTASMSHATFKAPGSKTFVIGFPGATLTFTAVTTDYQVTHDQAGTLVWTVPFSLSSGTPAVWS